LLVVTRPDLRLGRRLWFDCILAGVLAIGLPLEFSFMALQYLSSGLFTIFLSFTGIGTILVAHFLLVDEPASPAKLLGAGLAFMGVVALIVTRSTGLAQSGDIRGYLFALAVVLCFSFGNVYTRRRLRQIDPFVATAIGIGASLIISLPFTLWANQQGDLAHIGRLSWSAAIYSSIVGSFLYFSATYWVIKTFGATTVSLVYFVIPVVSALLGAILLGEIITASMLAGASLVFLGLFLVNRPETRLARSRP
jgi:drug/metabolite transporter (DMT)-like permease